MIIYIQWAKAVPGEWERIDLQRRSDLNKIPFKNEPTGDQVVDNNNGWINSINCQGLVFEGYDGYNIHAIQGGVRITAWQNDPNDYLPDEFFACEYTILDPAPDPKIENRINTRQTVRIWAGPVILPRYSDVDNATILPWSEFIIPNEGRTFYGIWLSDSLFMEHKNLQAFHGWREWVNG